MPRRVLVGQVVSHSDKTALVRVKGVKHYSMYGKSVIRYKKYASHDEKNVFQKGDWVRIRESRPFSKTKHWEVMEKIEDAAEGSGA